jgi:hypothetical protein
VAFVRSDGIRPIDVLADTGREPTLQGMPQDRVREGIEIAFGKLGYIYSGDIYSLVTHLPPPFSPFAMAAVQNCLLG